MPSCLGVNASWSSPSWSVRRGFTLVELLVVIGIVALLISILMPALQRARTAAQRTQCLSNLRQIAVGYRMYIDENRGFLPRGHPDSHASHPHLAGFVPHFIGTAYDGTHSNVAPDRRGNTREAIMNGCLWKYLKNVSIWKCPGAKDERLVSYGINCYLNGENFGGTVQKATKVKRHDRVFVLIDEYDPRGGEFAHNLGSFGVLPLGNNQWIDPPGAWHDNGACVSFLDGHAVYIKWDLVLTKYLTGNGINTPDNRDLRKVQLIRGGKDSSGRDLPG